jgi:hypothetical protein
MFLYGLQGLLSAVLCAALVHVWVNHGGVAACLVVANGWDGFQQQVVKLHGEH